MTDRAAIVIIGRNEGARLVRCLASVDAAVERVVYVDSGSTDGSVEAARVAGSEVLQLDLSTPFTAARARNSGIAALRETNPPEHVQFLDGDCELQPRWIATALAFLAQNPRAAVVSGRLRERFPEASIYNRLCDWEWNTPVGKVSSCGGIAMMRWAALDQVSGFNPLLIAGEDSELCVRLRAHGWEIWALDSEMALHDAAMTRFGQWWKRVRRGGYAIAEGAALHGATPERYGIQSVRRALLWGLALPAIALGGSLFSPWALTLFLALPAQVVRLARREGGTRGAWEQALFLTLGKMPEALGVLEYYARRKMHRPAGLIEYK